MSDTDTRDLYEILGIEAGSDEKEVARAYKKKSLLHHPDRGGDVKKFHELQRARDILLDPKKKSDYDKKLSQELMTRKREREREVALSNKRKKMRDEHLRKEQSVDARRRQQREESTRRSQVSKLREKTVAYKRNLQDSLSRDSLRRDNLDRVRDADRRGSQSRRTVTMRWDRKRSSHSDETIFQALRQYGDIETIKLKSGTAKVVFSDMKSAAHAVRVEGHSPAWREVSLQGYIVNVEDLDSIGDSGADTTPSLPEGPISLAEHLTYEHGVLEMLRNRSSARGEEAILSS